MHSVFALLAVLLEHHADLVHNIQIEKHVEEIL